MFDVRRLSWNWRTLGLRLGLAIYALSIGWFLADYLRSGITEIWGLVGHFLPGVAAAAFLEMPGRSSGSMDLLFGTFAVAFAMGTGLILYSGLGARGVGSESRALLSMASVLGVFVALGSWLLAGRAARGPRNEGQT